MWRFSRISPLTTSNFLCTAAPLLLPHSHGHNHTHIPLTAKELASVAHLSVGTAQLETLVCIAQRSFSSPFSESTRTVLSPRLSFLPIWKWSCALRNHHNILLWFFDSGKSSRESDVPGVRKQTFTATAISKPDSGKFCLLLITNIFLYCIQIRISQLSHFKPLGVFLLF